MEIGRNLNFDDYVSLLCKKVVGKLAVLGQSSNLKQKRILMKTFLNLSFDIACLSECFIVRK